MPMIRGLSTRIRREEQMVIAKDARLLNNIHYGRNMLTRVRAYVYRFLDHPRYHKNYRQYLPVIFYHVALYLVVCICGLVLELENYAWLNFFAFYKWGIRDFDTRRIAQAVGMFFSFLLVVEYIGRVWSCVANTKYGGDHKEMDPARIAVNHRRGRIRYIFEYMNLLELVITVITFMCYWVWTPHPHLRFVILARAIHWDKSVHAVRLIREILTKGQYLLPCFAAGFILILINSCSVYQCEKYYRLENDTTSESDIDNLGDAMWFSYVSSMSIGYGDRTPKTAICRILAASLSYSSNILIFSVQTAVSIFLVKHIAIEANARQDKKVQNLAAKVIQSWARFHLARRKSPAMDTFTENCCKKLYQAKKKIDQQRRSALLSLPGTRLIKRARRSQMRRERSRDSAEDATGPPASALARKRGSLPNHLHGLISMTVATASVFGNRQESLEEEDYSSTNQNTVDERFLRQHKDRSGVSSISRTKTTREEFGPLVIMIQFLLFGHYKRRFRKTEFRQPPEKKIQDEQEKLTQSVREVEKKFEELVESREACVKDVADAEKAVDRLFVIKGRLEDKVKATEILNDFYSGNTSKETHGMEMRKRKMTVLAVPERKDSEEQEVKRKHTII